MDIKENTYARDELERCHSEPWNKERSDFMPRKSLDISLIDDNFVPLLEKHSFFSRSYALRREKNTLLLS